MAGRRNDQEDSWNRPGPYRRIHSRSVPVIRPDLQPYPRTQPYIIPDPQPHPRFSKPESSMADIQGWLDSKPHPRFSRPKTSMPYIHCWPDPQPHPRFTKPESSMPYTQSIYEQFPQPHPRFQPYVSPDPQPHPRSRKLEPSMPYVRNLAVPPPFEQFPQPRPRIQPYFCPDIQPDRRFSMPEASIPKFGVPPPYISSTPVGRPWYSNFPEGPSSFPSRPQLDTLPAVTMSPDLHTSFILGVHRGQEEAAMGRNFVYSPLSMRTALGLLAGLLHGKNQDSVLSFAGCSTLGELNTTSASLIQACRPSNKKAMLRISIANGVWVDRRLALEPSFLEDSKYIYKAFVNQVDFKTQHHDVREQINKWIKKETRGLIKNFLPGTSPDKDTLLALANALYFKGTWDHGFDIHETKVDDFYLLDGGKRVKVPYMTGNSRHEFFSFHKGLKSLMLPYLMDDKDERHLSLHILLPEKKDGLTDLAKELAYNPSFFDDYLPKVKTEVALIKIPKFKISSKFNATDALTKMGLHIGRLKSNDGTTVRARLEAFHGATIEVDEEGTTASAVTCFTGVMMSCGARPLRPPPKVFVADHPFIYAIREDESGAILFFGHVANPCLN